MLPRPPQALLRNPELLRSMLQANPAVRQMVEANPEVGRMLSDPDTLRQMAQVMSNPVRPCAQAGRQRECGLGLGGWRRKLGARLVPVCAAPCATWLSLWSLTHAPTPPRPAHPRPCRR